MATSQEQLRKIGLEGFDLIEKFYGRRFSATGEGIWAVRQLPEDEMENPVLKTREVANYSAYQRAKSHNNRWGRPITF